MLDWLKEKFSVDFIEEEYEVGRFGACDSAIYSYKNIKIELEEDDGYITVTSFEINGTKYNDEPYFEDDQNYIWNINQMGINLIRNNLL